MFMRTREFPDELLSVSEQFRAVWSTSILPRT